MKLGLDNPCPCGSGRNYKHCCKKNKIRNSSKQSSSTLSKSATAPIATANRTPDFNSMLTLFNSRRYAELESQVKTLLETNPDEPFAWQLLGGALQMQGKNALYAFKKVSELSPNDAAAHFNLGVAYKSEGQFEHAITSYRRALVLKPDYVEALNNLNNVLTTLEKQNIRGNLPLLNEFNQLISLFNEGQYVEVEKQVRLVINQSPESGVAWKLLGNCLHRQGKNQDALASLIKATKLLHNDSEAYFNLGIAQASLGQHIHSAESYRKAISIQPNSAKAYNNLGTTLLNLGQVENAIESYQKAIAISPDYSRAHSNFLFALNHHDNINAQALFAEHLFFAEQFEQPLKANWSKHKNSKEPKRCLQIGFVSAELCSHAVTSFLESVLANLGKYPGLSLHAYYNNTIEDDVTRRMKLHFKYWHSVANLSDDELANKIRLDSIDILYDLSGHMTNNRILTFARKPSPLQISWIAYPCTTGLNSMDYYQADRFLFPDNRFNSIFTEKIVRLNASSAFLPIKDAPPVNDLPALTNGYITFGSFNRICKINKPVVTLWAKLMRALPNSKMLLGAMPKDEQYHILLEWFAQNGIEKNRLTFHPNGNTHYYLSLHHQVDICLDTFPYNGETTTCNALWMGVPTLTLSQQTVASWVGTSILGHFNLQSFAAHNETDFLEKGLLMANNLIELSKIRAGLRERFATSAKCQPQLVAASMERALRTMWQRWCAGLAAESFDVD